MPTLAEYQEIARQYQHKLFPRNEVMQSVIISGKYQKLPETNGISTWRNFFTGAFYNGKYAGSSFYESLVGGIKFGSTSQHANFIALVDQIAKLGFQEKDLFSRINNYKKDFELGSNQTDQSLLEIFFDYFEQLQQRCEADLGVYDELTQAVADDPQIKITRDEIKEYYAQQLRDLKKSINRLAQQHHIPKRISKKNPDGTQAEKKEEEKKSTPLLKINYFAETFGSGYYTSQNYREKMTLRNRKKTARNIAKFISLLAAIGDGIIICNAAKAVIFLALPSVAWPIAIILAIAGVYAYYNLYSVSLYDGLKEIVCGNFFKSVNSETHAYESSNYKRIAAIAGITLLALGGGFCAWALVSYSTSTLLFGAVSMTGMAVAIPVALPSLIALTFLYCCTITKGIKEWDDNWKNFKKYFSEMTVNDIPRVFLDFLELALAIALMTTLGLVGYILFQGRGIDILHLWNMSNQAAAGFIALVSIFAAVNSSVKWLFGINKVVHMFDNIKAWLAQVPEPEVELNPIQKEDRRCRRIYTYLLNGSLILNAVGKGVLYANVAVHAFDQLGGPFHTLNQLGYATGITAASEFTYMVGPASVNAKRLTTETSVVPFSVFTAKASVVPFSVFTAKARPSRTQGATVEPDAPMCR